ncbi:hypothetical protein EFB08_14660 [Rufibacter latericius]|uniref:Uncharacterized protein n=1 Tax=Rufibacter latericius TaxID=2487040 RepID=A0A3M9MMG8_9BACT|nr:hypothetical protein EFB08_14660 [Rufibacter latericius]
MNHVRNGAVHLQQVVPKAYHEAEARPDARKNPTSTNGLSELWNRARFPGGTLKRRKDCLSVSEFLFFLILLVRLSIKEKSNKRGQTATSALRLGRERLKGKGLKLT